MMYAFSGLNRTLLVLMAAAGVIVSGKVFFRILLKLCAFGARESQCTDNLRVFTGIQSSSYYVQSKPISTEKIKGDERPLYFADFPLQGFTV